MFSFRKKLFAMNIYKKWRPWKRVSGNPEKGFPYY